MLHALNNICSTVVALSELYFHSIHCSAIVEPFDTKPVLTQVANACVFIAYYCSDTALAIALEAVPLSFSTAFSKALVMCLHEDAAHRGTAQDVARVLSTRSSGFT
jgi:hypothetical protein